MSTATAQQAMDRHPSTEADPSRITPPGGCCATPPSARRPAPHLHPPRPATDHHAVRDFLGRAREHRHARRILVPAPGRHPGPAITDAQRCSLLARLLHDDEPRAHRPGRWRAAAALRPATLPHHRPDHRAAPPPRRAGVPAPWAATRSPSPNYSPGCSPRSPATAAATSASARPPPPGPSPACSPVGRRPRPDSANDSAPSASTPNPATAPRSPPNRPRPCSSTCSTRTRPPPSAGSTTPAVTGTDTQHN